MELKPFFKLAYCKNKYEFDLVYNDSQVVIPVEVKYMEQPTDNGTCAGCELETSTKAAPQLPVLVR